MCPCPCPCPCPCRHVARVPCVHVVSASHAQPLAHDASSGGVERVPGASFVRRGAAGGEGLHPGDVASRPKRGGVLGVVKLQRAPSGQGSKAAGPPWLGASTELDAVEGMAEGARPEEELRVRLREGHDAQDAHADE